MAFLPVTFLINALRPRVVTESTCRLLSIALPFPRLLSDNQTESNEPYRWRQKLHAIEARFRG